MDPKSRGSANTTTRRKKGEEGDSAKYCGAPKGSTMKAVAPTDVAGLARLILSPECRSIVVLTGAGASVAASIPDFRSPGGMYETLRPELLTATSQQKRAMAHDPTNVVSWDIFQHNPFPYLEVRRPFILGTRSRQWKATIAHRFWEMLHVRTDNKLTRLYTQNIDGLDRQCSELPSEKVIAVHGTLSEASCEGCGHVANYDAFCDRVQHQIKDIYCTDPSADPRLHPTESTPILCEKCQLPLVKPRTVLFGRSLPDEFWDRVHDDCQRCDLLIVAGTSLVVAPANMLVQMVPPSCVRVVANLEPVGTELGIDAYGLEQSSRDGFMEGPTDETFLHLIQELGWIDDLVAKRDVLPEASRELLDRHLEDAKSSEKPKP
jgi:NAD-dependent SIR2 family protein deacetylase